MSEYTPFKMKGFSQHAGTPVKKKGPCWEGYEMVGMKKKGGRTVPNCVPNKGGKIAPPTKAKISCAKCDDGAKPCVCGDRTKHKAHKSPAKFEGEGKMKASHKGYTKAERDNYRRRKQKEGWKGDDLKEHMKKWKASKRPTSVTKVKKKDLLAEGAGMGAK